MIKNTFLAIKSRFFVTSLALAFIALSLISTVSAQTTTFAQFSEKNGTQDFVFANNGTSASFSTISGGSPIDFKYFNISGLPVSLQGFQDAHLFVTSNNITTPAVVNGTDVAQPLNTVTVVSIIRDTAAPVGVGSGSRTNLLTMTVTTSGGSADIDGSIGGSSATLNASTPTEDVVFTSDFLSFVSTTSRNGALSFSSVTPNISVGAGGFLSAFTAAASGTFASNPPPVYVPPTASPITIAGRVVAPSGRGLSNTTVTMYDSEGLRRVARSNGFGFFSFVDVEPVGLVTIEVVSKRYQYAPQSFSSVDSITDIVFSPMELGAAKSVVGTKK